MKRIFLAILGTMAIGSVAMTPALAASPVPQNEPGLAGFTKDLRKGMNLVELRGSTGGIIIEKDGDTLYAWATSAEERSFVPDGTYKISRAGINECVVREGIVESCR